MKDLNMVDIHIAPFASNGYEAKRIEFRTQDRNKYVNIYTYSAEKMRDLVCASGEDMKKLRDALIEMYPLYTSRVYDPNNPKVGDLVIAGPRAADYPCNHWRGVKWPAMVTEVRHAYGDILVFIEGAATACYSYRLEAPKPAAPALPLTETATEAVLRNYGAKSVRRNHTSPPMHPSKDFIVAITNNFDNPHPSSNPTRHGSKDSAMKEAERLSSGTPGNTFAVYERVGQVTAHPPIQQPVTRETF